MMNKRDRLAVADAFRRAKDFLLAAAGFPNPGQSRYICCALDLSLPLHHTREMRLGNDMAESVIGRRIIGCAFLDSWVIANIPGAREFSKTDYPAFQHEMQAFRHRWLDALIEEFSK